MGSVQENGWVKNAFTPYYEKNLEANSHESLSQTQYCHRQDRYIYANKQIHTSQCTLDSHSQETRSVNQQPTKQ